MLLSPAGSGPLGLQASLSLDACALADEAFTDTFASELNAALSPSGALPAGGRAAAGPAASPASQMLLDLDPKPELLLSEAPGELQLLQMPAPPAAGNWDAFPAIPEESELQLSALDAAQMPRLAPVAVPPPASQVMRHPEAASGGGHVFVPVEGGSKSLPSSPISAMEGSGLCSGGTSPTGSAASSLLGDGHGVPRVASMPNLQHYHRAEEQQQQQQQAMQQQQQQQQAQQQRLGGPAGLRRAAAANRAMPRSRSASDVSDLAKYNIPHISFLTPPHLRKGKGGRQVCV